MTSSKIHAFNTTRMYSPKGQRIAWAILSTGNVAMVDVDRNIDYVLLFSHEFPPADNSDIMFAYDHNRTQKVYNKAEDAEAYALCAALSDAARNTTVISRL